VERRLEQVQEETSKLLSVSTVNLAGVPTNPVNSPVNLVGVPMNPANSRFPPVNYYAPNFSPPEGPTSFTVSPPIPPIAPIPTVDMNFQQPFVNQPFPGKSTEAFPHIVNSAPFQLPFVNQPFPGTSTEAFPQIVQQSGDSFEQDNFFSNLMVDIGE
jgi:hypothetical protein